MIYILIVITVAGGITTQPFRDSEDCYKALQWVHSTTGKGGVLSSVKAATCMSVRNPY